MLAAFRVFVGWRGYVLVALLGFGCAWLAQGWRQAARIADMERVQAQQLMDATQQARDTERARWAEREDVIHEAKKREADALADAAAANTAAERLRQQVASLQRRARDTAAAAGSEAAADPIGVLAVVLGELDDRAGTLARYADASRIAGLACERAYDSLR